MAAAADTAASPKPRPLKKLASGGRQQQRKRARDAAGSAASSGGSSGDEASSDGERGRAASGGAGSSGRQGGGGGAAEADPLAAWFKHHYSLLQANGLLQSGLTPASAETGALAANGTRRTSRGGGGGGRQRSKAAGVSERGKRAQRQAAREVSQEVRITALTPSSAGSCS